jgi:uncharacterized SAM-binding protein YcdF (DUF218 family)
MFFLISKVLSFLITPFFWVFVLLLMALFSKKANRKKGYLIFGILLLFLFSNNFLFNEVCQKYESPFTKLEDVENYDYAVVLGGFASFDVTYSKIKFGETSDRLWQTLQLYHQKKAKKIFISGGSGLLLHQDETEADKVKAYLISINIPETDVIMEMTSRNTHENAVNTQHWLKKHDPSARCLLVTSALHMRRALGCYKKTGLNVTPYSTNKLSDIRRFDFDNLILPNVDTMYKWNLLIREWVGYVTYKIMRYS